jgi:AhpD family alkylhydroperoxidase
MSEARLNFYETAVGAKFSQQIHQAAAVVSGSTLPYSTQELVRIRASQLNGSSFCLDIHFKDALGIGDTPLRLNLVACWRDAGVFTGAERAALALTEQGTRLGAGRQGVSDDTWADASKVYDPDQLAALVAQVALINAFNRINVITGQRAGRTDLVQFHEHEHRHPRQH